MVFINESESELLVFCRFQDNVLSESFYPLLPILGQKLASSVTDNRSSEEENGHDGYFLIFIKSWMCFLFEHIVLFHFELRGAWWLIGIVSDSGVRGRGFRNLPSLSCVLEQATLLPKNTGNSQEAVAPAQPD